MRHTPALARGDLEIVAIARRPRVLTKVAVRRRPGVKLAARPVSLVVGVGADYVNQVRAELGGERIEVFQWVGDPASYIASALGLGYLPPIEVFGVSRLANVLLGDIDVRGTRGRGNLNVLLASVLTGWRIRLREIASAPAWKELQRALDQRRSVPATVETRVPKGLAVSVYGLNALLPTGRVRGIRRSTPANIVDAELRARLGHTAYVQVLRLDPDAGHIFVSEQEPAGRQLPLFPLDG